MGEYLVCDKTGSLCQFGSVGEAEQHVMRLLSKHSYLKPKQVFKGAFAEANKGVNFDSNLYSLKSVAVWVYANLSIETFMILKRKKN